MLLIQFHSIICNQLLTTNCKIALSVANKVTRGGIHKVELNWLNAHAQIYYNYMHEKNRA